MQDAWVTTRSSSFSGPGDGTLGAGGDTLWETFTDEEREAVAALVRDTLEALLRDVDGWLPSSLEVFPDGHIELNIVWQMAAVEAAVLLQRAHAAVDTEARIGNLWEMIRRHGLNAD